jgi:hypothetical protein
MAPRLEEGLRGQILRQFGSSAEIQQVPVNARVVVTDELLSGSRLATPESVQERNVCRW